MADPGGSVKHGSESYLWAVAALGFSDHSITDPSGIRKHGEVRETVPTSGLVWRRKVQRKRARAGVRKAILSDRGPIVKPSRFSQ